MNPIKRRGKIPLRQLKKLLEILAITENVFQQQQQIRGGQHQRNSRTIHKRANKPSKRNGRE